MLIFAGLLIFCETLHTQSHRQRLRQNEAKSGGESACSVEETSEKNHDDETKSESNDDDVDGGD
jgi:hypothetical protein